MLWWVFWEITDCNAFLLWFAFSPAQSNSFLKPLSTTIDLSQATFRSTTNNNSFQQQKSIEILDLNCWQETQIKHKRIFLVEKSHSHKHPETMKCEMEPLMVLHVEKYLYFSMQHARKSDCNGYIVSIDRTKNTAATQNTPKIDYDNNGPMATELSEMVIRWEDKNISNFALPTYTQLHFSLKILDMFLLCVQFMVLRSKGRSDGNYLWSGVTRNWSNRKELVK